jgi:hypothetical protein
MKKLEAYKQVCADVETAREICREMDKSLYQLGTIHVASNISIDRGSSDKQFIYGLGLLMSQETAAVELKFGESELQSFRDKKANLIKLRELTQDLRNWQKYWSELEEYKDRLEELLTDKEKFSLLEYPAKPEQKA